MLKRLRQHLYFVSWYGQVRLLGRRKPLQSVIFINNSCNLTCKHCCVYKTQNPTVKPYQQIEEELKRCYKAGSRFIDFEGGEPFLWRDGYLNINDLFDLAKNIGFFSTTVTTNAQLPFNHCRSDLIWVSLDGVGHYHDAIRGEGAFEKLEKNVALSDHRFLNANMVVNRLNIDSVEETIRFVTDHPKFKLIAINFHTPYPGTEELELDRETRIKVIDKILQLRRRGAPLMNTARGLERMKTLDFKKNCWITNFVLVDGSWHDECQGKKANLCDRCGFAMSAEMQGLYELRPETIVAGLKVRM